MKRLLLPVFLILIFVGVRNSGAELTMVLKNIDFSVETIDVSEYPYYTAKFKLMKDGNYVQADESNFVVLYDNTFSIPEEVSQPEDDWQTIRWYMKKNVSGIIFLAQYDNEITLKQGYPGNPNASFLSIRNHDGLVIKDMHMGYATAGDSTRKQIWVVPLTGKRDADNYEMGIYVSSISNNKPEFSWGWQGNEVNRKAPPVTTNPGSFYLADIYYHPDEYGYHRDILTVEYDNRTRSSINLIAGSYPIVRETLLQLVQPDGGEILEPCEEYEIKWTGSAKDLPTNIEFSTDGGASWKTLGKSYDSVLVWTVPKDFTEEGRIRLNQDFTANKQYTFRYDYTPVRKIVYNFNGKKLLSANEAGTIVEWDVHDKVVIKDHLLNDFYPGITTSVKGVEYITDDRFAVAYRLNSYSPGITDSIAFFDTDKTEAVATVSVGDDFTVKEMYVDSERNFLALTPVLGNRMMLLSPEDASFIKYVDFPWPIYSVNFNRELQEAAVYMLNGKVQILNLPDFTVKKEIDLSYLPIIKEMGLSPDGTLLAIGCLAPTYSHSEGANTEIHVVDINLGDIVRTTRLTASDPVGLEFSPTSKTLVVGSEAQPQIAFWDLTTSKYIGSLSGTTSELTDFAFSPEGHSVAVGSSSSDNLVIREFTYPESDVSNNSFIIAEPNLDIDTLTFSAKYLGTENRKTFNSVICNKGLAPISFEKFKFEEGRNFSLVDEFEPFRLMPGECRDIELIFFPKDTGDIIDKMIFNSECLGDYNVILKAEGINRNITFSREEFDMGESCVGVTAEKTMEILTNNDPVPLIINSIQFVESSGNPFGVTPVLIDTVIPAKSSLKYTLTFKPSKLGEIRRKMIVYHSEQGKIIPEVPIKGFGIGTKIDVSHTNLLFIPEIPERNLIIKNSNENDIEISSAEIVPEGNFTILSSFPIKIQKGDSAEIKIRWNRQSETPAEMNFMAAPCVSNNTVYLGFYTANSKLSLPTIEADPKANAVIPVNYSTSEYRSYKGIRFLEAEFTIHPGIFLPLSVSSKYGDAEIIRNEVVSGKRYIGVRVDGDFPASGTAALIEGVAGLTDTDSSPILYTESPEYWGTAVNVELESGLFKLTNLCGDRRILSPDILDIVSVSPNPTDGEFTLDFDINESGKCEIEIYDNLGQIVMNTDKFDAKEGINRVIIDVSRLKSGNYRVVVKNGNTFGSTSVTVIK